MTRDEVEAFTFDFGGEIGVLTGWKALRFRAFQIAMRGEDKDSSVMIKWLHERAFGMPKQEVSIEERVEREVDWSVVPIERRKVLLAAMAELELLSAPVDGDAPVEH